MAIMNSYFMILFSIVIGYILGYYHTQKTVNTYQNDRHLQEEQMKTSLNDYSNLRHIALTGQSNNNGPNIPSIPLSLLHDDSKDDDDHRSSSTESKSSTPHHVCQAVSKELFHSMTKNTKNDDDVDDDEDYMIPHTSYLWKYFEESILEATRPVNDAHFAYRDFMVELMKYMTPSRLATSRKTLPLAYWDQVEKIIQITYARWKYVHHNDGNVKRNVEEVVPRKLSIVVFGGSVTVGSYCYETPIEYNINSTKLPYQDDNACNWANRLHHFFNKLFLGPNFRKDTTTVQDTDIVKVYNVGKGATNTINGRMIWDLSLLPPDIPRNPDIIINAYSTNDVHQMFQGDDKGKYDKTTVIHPSEQVLLDMEQDFIRRILAGDDTSSVNNAAPINPKDDSNNAIPTTSESPLLIYYDDYVGNSEKGILALYHYNNVMNMMSNYYGFGFISYVDAVRDMVYTDTNESWFSTSGWPEIHFHPGQGMHISTVWMMAYNLFDYVLTYCSDRKQQHQQQQQVVNDDPIRMAYTARNNYQYKDRPTTRPMGVLPPPLQWNLTLDNISNLWNKAAVQKQQQRDKKQKEQQQTNHSNGIITDQLMNPCYYANVGIVSKSVEEFENGLSKYMTYNKGWETRTDHLKLGYVATPELIDNGNSTFIMLFPNISQRVQVIHIIYMRSYGQFWYGSELQITSSVIHRNDQSNSNNKHQNNSTNTTLMTAETTTTPIQQQQIFKISGHQPDRDTSEVYNDKLRMTKEQVANVGDDIQLQFQLIHGKTFKLVGIALCDR